MKHLVYPEERKSLILTFVNYHHSAMKVSDDVINGKGIIGAFDS